MTILVFIASLMLQIAPPTHYCLLEDKYSEPGVAESFKVGGDWYPLPPYKDRAAWNELLDDEARAYLIETGNKYLDYKWQHIPASTFLAMKLTGDKQALRKIEIANRQAIIALMMAELAEGEGRFLMPIADALWFYGTSYHWSLSNQTHHVLPAYEHERVALGNILNASTVPVCWFMFHDEIDKIDPDICLTVENAVKRIILDPYLDESLDKSNWWLGFHRNRVNNWNPWCNYGALVTFFLMEKDQDRLDMAVSKAVRSVDCYMRSVGWDGCCDEGYAYWSQSVARLGELLQLLKDASGGRFDVLPDEHISRMATYISRVYAGRNADNDDIFVNFADSNFRTGGSCNSFRLWNVGKLFQVKELSDCGLYASADMAGEKFVCKAFEDCPAEGYRMMDRARRYKSYTKDLDSLNTVSSLVGFDKVLSDLRKDVPDYTWYPDTRQAFIRTGNGWFVGAKAGHNAESHNHNDVGSFVLYADGQPVLIDPGVGVYIMAMSKSETRYGIWSMRSDWHNCPDINGQVQVVGTNHKDDNVWFSEKKGLYEFSYDMGGAYDKDAQVREWHRSLKVIDNRKGSSLILEDSYSLDSRISPDVEHLVTAGDVRIAGRTVFISIGDVKMRVECSSSLIPTVEEMSIEDETLKANWGDSIRRINFVSAPNAPLKGHYRISVTEI